MTIYTPTKFTLSINLGNADMQSHWDIAAALTDVGNYLESNTGAENGIILDGNGNTVGKWDLESDDIMVACPCCASWVANMDLSGCEWEHDTHAATIRSVTLFNRPVIGDPIGEDILNHETYTCDYCQVEHWAQYSEQPYRLADLG